MNNDQAREYLRSVHITKLQSAARFAGLRFKNGAPGYDKEGIIERLSGYQAMLSATVAFLQRMEGGEPMPAPAPSSSLLDDMLEETKPALEAPNGEKPSPVSDAMISGLLRRLDALEGYAISRTDAGTIAQQVMSPFSAELKSIRAMIAELQAQKPVQFHIGNYSPAPIKGNRHFSFKKMAYWLHKKQNCLLIGPASSGKTTAAIQFAEDIEGELYSQPMALTSVDILGYLTPNGERVETEFTRAWLTPEGKKSVFLYDEIMMSSKDSVGALNAALANGFCTIPGIGKVYRPEGLYIIAGANTDAGASIAYGAQDAIDGSTLDRFVRIEWPIDEKIEDSLGAAYPSWIRAVRAIRAEIQRRDIQHVGATMRATMAGCAALADGFLSRVDILHDTCRKGVIAGAEWPAFERLPAVQAFIRGE